jgi:hypothetical protein
MKYLKVIISEASQSHSLQARMLLTALNNHWIHHCRVNYKIRDAKPKEKDDIDLTTTAPSIYKADMASRGTSMEHSNHRPTKSVPPPITPHMLGYEYEKYCVNQAMNGPPKDGRRRQRQLNQPVPDPKHIAAKGPSLYDATITCEACGLQGHPAIHCFALGAVVLIDKYIANKGNNAVTQSAVDFWMQRNAPLICDNQTDEQIHANPLKIMKTYATKMNLTTDEITDEMDWHYFDEGPNGSTVQEVFGILGWQADSMEHDESK